MNGVYLSLINLCAQSLPRSISVSIVIWFPLRNVRNKCECAHTKASGHGIRCHAICTIYIIYCDKPTSMREEI